MGATFLRNPFGARAAAMGATAAAGAQGAESMFQNPACLAKLEPESPSEAAFGYEALVETAYQGAGAYATPLGRGGALGLGALYASQSAQTRYSATGDSAGSFTPLDLAAGAAYAHRLGPVALGAGLKLVRSSLDSRKGATAAADLGIFAPNVSELGEGPLDVGFAVSNLGPPLKIGETADPLPLGMRAGALWHLSPTADVAVDVVAPVDDDPHAALGVEWRFPASMVGSKRPWSFAVRAGFDQGRTRGVDGTAGITAGAGADLAGMRFDYAWLALGDLGSVNRITLAFRFGGAAPSVPAPGTRADKKWLRWE